MNVEDWDGTGALPILYSRTATGAINQWLCWVEDDNVCVQWGQMDGAVQRASFKCKPKNEGRSNATTGNQQAIKEAKAKWVKQVKKKYSPALETAGETKRVKPMLALDIKKRTKPIEFPALMQPKLDGVRCLAYRMDGHVVLQSRGGEYRDVEHIRGELEKCLPDGAILDGELYLHGASLQSITSLVNRPQVESVGLYYCTYDITNVGHTLGEWGRRHELLGQFYAQRPNLAHTNIRLVNGVVVHSQADVDYYQEQYMNQGYEGGIIRTWDGLYKEDHRSPNLIKVKSWEDAEFQIVGWTVGKGKYENAPVFRCTVTLGDLHNTFEVVPMGTAGERYQMLQDANSYMNQLLKVKFLGWTDAGKPKCARGIAIRHPSDM